MFINIKELLIKHTISDLLNMRDIIDISLQSLSTIFNDVSLLASHDVHETLGVELSRAAWETDCWIVCTQLFMKATEHLVLAVHMPLLVSNLY